MKNTKGLSGVITTLIMILLCIVCIGIIWVIVSPYLELLEKPEFTITKEECFNEGNEVRIDYKCENGNMGSLILLIPIKWNSIEEDCNFTFSYISNATCNQVEVDDIKIYEERCCSCKEDFSKPIANCDIKKERCPVTYVLVCEEFFVLKDKISKEDLTIDWLSENCECVVDGETCRIYKTKEEASLSLSGTKDCAITIEYDCKKYKCGEYFVEVK